MATQEPQSYANHRRIDPPFHVVLFGLFAANFIVALVALIRHPSGGSAWAFVMSAALVLFLLKLRAYSLQNQDRIIRMEETFRMHQLLPTELKARVSELRMGQFVGLRFASDGELADRVREALDENLDREAIKKRIQSWRADFNRV